MAHFQRDVLQKAACTPTEIHEAVEVVVPCCNSKVQKAYHARLPVLHRWAVICQTNACFSEDGFQCPRHERGNGSNNHCCPPAARNVVFCTLRSCQSCQTVSSSRQNEIASCIHFLHCRRRSHILVVCHCHVRGMCKKGNEMAETNICCKWLRQPFADGGYHFICKRVLSAARSKSCRLLTMRFMCPVLCAPLNGTVLFTSWHAKSKRH